MLLNHPEAFAWADTVQGWLPAAQASLFRLAAQPLQWPFDALRAQYGAAVRAGFLERSLIASARFDQQVDQLERLTLGPLARSYR